MSTLTTLARPPSAPTRDLSIIVRRLTSRMEEIPGSYRTMAIARSDAPSDAEREELEGRRSELSASLSPGLAKELEYELLALRAGFGSSAGRDEVSSAVEAKIAAKALAGFPAWCVAKACARAIGGEAETIAPGPHCPSPPQIAVECRAILDDIHTELASIDDILSARIQPDPNADMAARARAVIAWQDTKAQIAGQNPRSVEDARREAEQHLSELARENQGRAVVIGDELRAKLAQMRGAA